MANDTATSTRRDLDAHLLRVVAVEAEADPRSVTKVLAGEPMRSSVRLRIERALRDLQTRGALPEIDRSNA